MSDLTDVQKRLDKIGGALDETYEDLSAALDKVSPCDTIVWDALTRDRALSDVEKAKLKEHLGTIDGLLKAIRNRQKQIKKQIDKC